MFSAAPTAVFVLRAEQVGGAAPSGLEVLLATGDLVERAEADERLPVIGDPLLSVGPCFEVYGAVRLHHRHHRLAHLHGHFPSAPVAGKEGVVEQTLDVTLRHAHAQRRVR